ncbi:ABC transporter permease [Microbacterium soli]|uniref:ABC transporter permease n=1 Tax=Microbacterium soli TaxID=446075 RepID=A0ABP7N437_9MICO
MTAVQTRAAYNTAPAYRRTFLRQLRSELIKLMTVRSTWWSVGIVGVITVGIAWIGATAITMSAGDPIMLVVSPVQFTMMLAGILGVIAVTGEYSTGMVRSTFTANPVRGAVVAAKAVVLAAFMFVVSLVIFVAAAAVISPIAASKDMALAWANPDAVILPIAAASAAMALFALLGVGLGFLLRSGAGAIAITVGILFVLPIVMTILGALLYDVEWVARLADYLPASAAPSAILPSEGSALSVPAAWATLAAWPAAALLGGWAVVRGRDV